jgi:cytochrome P450
MNGTVAIVASSALLYFFKDDALGSVAVDPQVKRIDGHLPLVGGLFPALRKMDQLNALITQEFQKDIKAVVLSLPFQPPFVLVNDPAVVEYVLSTRFDFYVKGNVFYDRMTDVFGSGIFNTDGAQWYRQRKLASRVFTTNTFKNTFNTVFAENITLLLDFIAKNEGKRVDMHDMYHRFFLDSFAKIAFGVDLHSLTENVDFALAFDSSQRAVSARFFNPFWKVSELFRPSLRKDVRTVRSFGLQVVQQRRAEMEQGVKKPDLLQLFMEYKDEDGVGLSDDELVDQVINFIIAGRDTTAQALSWATFSLHSHPKIVAKMLEEANRVMGPKEKGWSTPTYDQVKELKYSLAVLKETLRLYPSVSRESKTALEDDILPNGIKVKKGTAVAWSPFAMGRSTLIWGEDAAEFKPERWENITPNAYTFPAFNGGPRICLGKTLAELQGVFVLISVLRHFDLTVTNPEAVESMVSLTLPMRNGLSCSVQQR